MNDPGHAMQAMSNQSYGHLLCMLIAQNLTLKPFFKGDKETMSSASHVHHNNLDLQEKE